MSQQLNRRRSATTVLQGESNGTVPSPRNRARFYSISSDIIPQTLTHPDDEEVSRTPRSSALFPPSWSHVGFQSIFQGGGQRRSKQSLISNTSPEDTLLSAERSNESIAESSPRVESRISEEDHSNESVHTTGSSTKSKLRSTIFGRSKDNLPISDRSSRLFRSSTHKSSSSLSGSLMSASLPHKSNPLSKVARKLFQHKSHSVAHDDDVEPALPKSLSKFLHSSYARHKAPSQFMHSATGPLLESRSAYSFNTSIPNSQNDKQHYPLEDDGFFTTNVVMLHDLLKNLPTLEANYRDFHVQELHVLEGNVWGVYCSIILELFKSKRIWQLPVKIEDINRVLSFYICLKIESKATSPHGKLLSEIEEFLTTSLYIMENQIVFNYTNEDIMNTALKRLGVIWQIFYQQVYYDVMAVLIPLERSFRVNGKYWAENSFTESSTQDILSVDYILLRCFRDSIVLPYYQNFINSNDGASKSFQLYIFNEEEENGVTEQDKLTLLQCFGVLSSIQGNDKHQKIIEKLLEGVRMSI